MTSQELIQPMEDRIREQQEEIARLRAALALAVCPRCKCSGQGWEPVCRGAVRPCTNEFHRLLEEVKG